MIDACGNSGHLWAGVWNPLNKQGLSAILTGRHFLHCSWNRSGSECIASDRRGTVLLINVKSNKWRQICHFTSVPCLLQFGLERSDEFLVAFPGRYRYIIIININIIIYYINLINLIKLIINIYLK